MIKRKTKPVSKKRVKRLNTDNTTVFLDEGVSIDNRIIHLFEEITPSSVSRVIRGIQLMITKNEELPIEIYINSEGGDPYSSFALYSFIRSLSLTVKIFVAGCAMSGASIILMAGDERYMYEESVLMLHSVSSSASGKVHLNLADETAECKRIHIQLCDIYAGHSNLKSKEWDKKIKHNDVYFRPEEALEIGLIDKIIKSV